MTGRQPPTFALLRAPIASTIVEDSFNAGPGDQQGVEVVEATGIGASLRRRSYPS